MSQNNIISEGDNILEKLWENKDILKKMKELTAEASKREAVCECNYDIASESWLDYIGQEYNVELTDHQLEELIERFKQERNKYPKRITR